MTGLVASALNAPNVVVDWTEDNLLRHIRLDPACDPKGLERILVSRRAVASGTAGEVFAGASISVPASMSLAALVDVSCRSDCCQKRSGPASGLGFGCEAYTPFAGICVEPVGCGKLQTATNK
jgi:hypothetical protein